MLNSMYYGTKYTEMTDLKTIDPHSTELAAIRPGSRLPPLTEEQIEKIRSSTKAQEAVLLANQLKPHSQRSYRSALRYWDAWHWARTGKGLPLFDEPKLAVPPQTVRDFISDHSATVFKDGKIGMAMDQEVLDRMRDIGAIGRRHVASRRPKDSETMDDKTAEVPKKQSKRDKEAKEPLIDLGLPAVATVIQRVALLNGAHTIMQLVAPNVADPGLIGILHGLRKATANLTPLPLRKAKQHLTAKDLDRILHACESDGLRGRRDGALLRLGFTGRRRGELASLKIEHLEPFDTPDLEDEEGWMWGVRESKGRTASTADGIVDRIPVIGYTAELLDLWIDTLKFLTKDSTGPVWRRLVRDEQGEWQLGSAMDEEDIADVVKFRMHELTGFSVDFDHTAYAGHSLRSGAARTAETARDAMLMLNHKSERTTREFYFENTKERLASMKSHEKAFNAKRRKS